MHDFNDNASNPGLLDALRDTHARLQAGVQTRLATKQPLIQPTLSYDYEKDLNGAEHDAKRIATQKKYLAALYKVVKAEEPTAYALLEAITNDVFANDPALTTAEVKLHRGPLKQMDRILEKADLKRYHFEEVRDYGRASWVVDSVSRVPALLQRLEDGNEFDVVRCKNRFDPNYKSQDSGGYRDYQLVLRTRVGAESLVPTSSSSSSPSSKLKPISCQWLYEVQIMTKGFHSLKMGISHDVDANAGDGGEDTAALAAHEAYKSFRKFQELCDRLETQAKEMKAELDLKIPEKLAVLVNVRESAAHIIFKKAKRNSSNKVGPAATVVTVSPPLPSLDAPLTVLPF